MSPTADRSAPKTSTVDKASAAEAPDRDPETEAETKSETKAETDPKTDPEAEAADWGHFGPAQPKPASALDRFGRRTTRLRYLAGHEWTLAALGGLVLAVALNWRALVDPAHTLPQDDQDPALVAYTIAWVGHAVLHAPGQVWNLNAFYPAPDGLAFSDPLLGYAPAAFVGSGATAAILRYNLVFILAVALTFVGAYALVRQLGAGRVGAAVAGLAWTVAPWRLAQAGHLHVLSAGGMALALAMLARGHGVRWRRPSPPPELSPDAGTGPSRRLGWVIGGWLVACWQLTIGFSLGLVFAYVLLGAFLVGVAFWAIRRRRLPGVRLLIADGVGGLVFAAVALLLARPYLEVFQRYPGQQRSAAWIELYSPPLSGFLTAPAESWLWGGPHAAAAARLSVPGEMTLLPGFALIALALGGLFFSVWSWRIRLALLVGIVVSVLLELGTNGPDHGRLGYLILLDHLPGFSGIRTPGRLIVWTTLLLALLAAGGIGLLADRARAMAQHRGLPGPTALAQFGLLVPLVLILVEGIGTTPHPTVPPEPAALAQVRAPYLVLPTDSAHDQLAMLWSTDHFGALVNGGSGVAPDELTLSRLAVSTFPDDGSVSYLRKIGVRTVVVIPGESDDPRLQQAADLSIDGLGITRQITGDAVVFSLSP